MSDTKISDEAVSNATGRPWADWFELLDEWGAVEREHKEIAAHLAEAHELTGWWSQMVTVQYERERGLREVGESSNGFQMSKQRTFMPEPQAAWQLVTSPAGLEVWLGEGAPRKLREGLLFELADGTGGEVRTIKPGERIRLAWYPQQWDSPSILQVWTNASTSGRGTICFQHQNLPDQDARDAMKEHWGEVLGRLKKLISD